MSLGKELFTRSFEKEKETKGTIMFKELTGEGERAWIGSIYILKTKLTTPFPEKISVTVCLD